MAAPMLNTLRMLAAVVAAAAVGLGVYFFTQLHEAIAVGAALISFAIVHFVIPRAQEDTEVMVASGVTRADLRAALEKGRQQIASLDAAGARIPASDPASPVLDSIEAIFKDIYSNLETDPGDIPRARAFLDFHSIDAVGLIDAYSRLVSNRLPDDKKLEQIEAARARFVAIEKAFRAQYNAMLANDVSALEQAGRNLESSLRLEHGLESVVAQSEAR